MKSAELTELFQTASECHELIGELPHVVIGGLAVWLHGYKRRTRDVDLLVRKADWRKIRQRLKAEGYVKKSRYDLLSPTGVQISFRFGGEKPGEFGAALPDPADTTFHAFFDHLSGIPVFGDLSELIKHKLECGFLGQRQGGGRAKRAKKHFGDVIGLIGSNGLLP